METSMVVDVRPAPPVTLDGEEVNRVREQLASQRPTQAARSMDERPYGLQDGGVAIGLDPRDNLAPYFLQWIDWIEWVEAR